MENNPAEIRVSTNERNEIVWTPEFSNVACRVRFFSEQAGKAPLCYLTRLDADSEDEEFELGVYLACWCSIDYWMKNWEGLFRFILKDNGNTVDLKYLRTVAEAGIVLAHERSTWPLFCFTFEIVKRFCWQVPANAAKEYLHFCIKEWNQRSPAVQNALLAAADHHTHRVVDQISFAPGPILTRDFGEACEAELAHCIAIRSTNQSAVGVADSKSITVDRIQLKCDTATFVHVMCRLFGEEFELFEKRDGRMMPWSTLAGIFADKHGKPLDPAILAQTRLNNVNTKEGKPRGAKRADPILDILRGEINSAKA